MRILLLLLVLAAAAALAAAVLRGTAGKPSQVSQGAPTGRGAVSVTGSLIDIQASQGAAHGVRAKAGAIAGTGQAVSQPAGGAKPAAHYERKRRRREAWYREATSGGTP